MTAPYEVWGNITDTDTWFAPTVGNFDIHVTGTGFSSPPGMGWRWRVGTWVVPHIVVSDTEVILQVRNLTLWGPGQSTVMNENQQPGDMLGYHAFTTFVPDCIASLAPNAGAPSGGVTIDVHGHDFDDATQEIVYPGSSGWVYGTIDSAFHGQVHMEQHTPGHVNVGLYLKGYDFQIAEAYYTYWDTETPPLVSPLPEGRGRWRLTLHDRAYAPNLHPIYDLFVAEVMDARSIQLTQKLNTSAQLTFTVDGTSAAASLIKELEHDVMAWRWDDQTGTDVPMFRGPVCQSQDTLTEQSDTVDFVCHDYISLLNRRLLPSGYVANNFDQDDIVGWLIEYGAKQVTAAKNGTSLYPGSYLPLAVLLVGQDGQQRAKSGQVRVRNYASQQDVFTAVDDLSRVIGGFDYDVMPGLQYSDGWPDDQLRIFYESDPNTTNQGQDRPDLIWEYGSTVAGVQRSVNSVDYRNYERMVGGSSNPADSAAPPLAAEWWDDSANSVTTDPQGLWMGGDNAADVIVQATLDEQAQGALATGGLLLPSYTLSLTPGAYRFGQPNMGDTIRLVVMAGRLNVNLDPLRVVGFTFVVGDSGQEDVTVVVGRPGVNFAQLFQGAAADINALARR